MIRFFQRSVLVLVVGFITNLTTNAQPPELEWARSYGSDRYDNARSVISVAEGGYLLAGRIEENGHRGYLVRTDEEGDTLWTVAYRPSQPDGEGDYPSASFRAVSQVSDGNFVTIGNLYHWYLVAYSVVIAKIDTMGNVLWVTDFQDIDAALYQVEDFVEASDGGLVFTGLYEAIYTALEVAKVDSESVDWVYSPEVGIGLEESKGYAITATLDGGYIAVGGIGERYWSHSDFYVVRLNAFGDSLWTRRYQIGETAVAYSIETGDDGGFVIAGLGLRSGNGTGDAVLVKINNEGNILWVRNYGGADYDIARAVRRTSDGGYILVGTTRSYGAGEITMSMLCARMYMVIRFGRRPTEGRSVMEDTTWT